MNVRGLGTRVEGMQFEFRPADAEITLTVAVAMYLAFGSTLLFVSEFLLPEFVSGPALAHLQASNGIAEVFVTAGFVFVLTKDSRRQLNGVNRRLRRHREELGVLHRVLQHNLRNNLNVVVGSARCIADRAGESPQAEAIEDRCASIVDAAEEMLELADTARLIQRVSDSEETARFDAVELLDGVVDGTDGARVTTSTPERAPVEAHVLFAEAVEELVENAVEHNDAAAPELSVRVTEERDRVRMDIRDNGPGIPPEVTEVVLSGQRDAVRHLDGLGLWFAYWCVDASGGEMDIETGGEGSRVRLSVPAAEAAAR
jgi:signal transduction histidine kinase